MFFRNKSNSVVRLEGQLIDKRYIDRLPNRVSVYNFPKKRNHIYGEWREIAFVTWLDTANFFINIPANSIVDLEDVTDDFALGLSFPKVILVAKTEAKTDTVAKGYYDDPVTTKFKEKRRFLGTSTLYYDFE